MKLNFEEQNSDQSYHLDVLLLLKEEQNFEEKFLAKRVNAPELELVNASLLNLFPEGLISVEDVLFEEVDHGLGLVVKREEIVKGLVLEELSLVSPKDTSLV